METRNYENIVDSATFSRFPAVTEPRRSRADILRRLCRMTAATSGLSVLLEDDYSATNPVAVRMKNAELVEVDPTKTLGGFNLLERDNPLTAPFLKRLVGGMMEPLGISRREMVDDFNWYSSAYVSKYRLGRGVDDCLLSVIDLPGRRPFLELVCLNRSSMNRLAFTARDGQSVRNAHVAYSAVDRTDPDVFVSSSPTTRVLTPADELQKVLEFAIKGETEQQLCISVGVDRATLDGHIKTILGEFQVASLAELTARWGKRRRLAN